MRNLGIFKGLARALDGAAAKCHIGVAGAGSLVRDAMNTGTILYTWVMGELVGTDEFGNRYYRSKGRRLNGRQRRWVLYKGRGEASMVPPEWHAWLHHTVAAPLTEDAVLARPCQKEHQPNRTGTAAAYRPRGHDLSGGRRAPASGDYEAWTPR